MTFTFSVSSAVWAIALCYIANLAYKAGIKEQEEKRTNKYEKETKERRTVQDAQMLSRSDSKGT